MASTNGSGTPRRDTRNHLLFEIATEVANRGLTIPLANFSLDFQLTPPFYRSSGRYLFRVEIQGSGHDCRIWRALHTYWSLEPSFGELPRIQEMGLR